MSKEQTEPNRKLPRSIIVAFVVLMVLAVLVTLQRKEGDTGKTATSPVADPAAAGIHVQEDPPSTAILRETRREGSRFACSVVGRIYGTMRQTTSLQAYHPIFKGDILSTWLSPWSCRFTAEVLRNDGTFIEERRTFEEVRSVELMTPAELSDLTYELDPKINNTISRLAARLREAYPPVGQAMGALIKSQDFDYAEVAKLTGIDRKILAGPETSVVGAAKILDDFEGKSIEVSFENGRARWAYGPELPPKVIETLGRVHSLLDYSALPHPELGIGETTTLSDLVINEMLPPELLNEVLGDLDTSLSLDLTRIADKTVGERMFTRFEGDGTIRLLQLDGNLYGRLNVQEAILWLDVTDSGNRYLHRLEIVTPVESRLLQKHSRFKEVTWEGDLTLDMVYEVNLTD